MNDIQIFNNPEFGSVRTLDDNGVILFCANDVARALKNRKQLKDVLNSTTCKAQNIQNIHVFSSYFSCKRSPNLV